MGKCKTCNFFPATYISGQCVNCEHPVRETPKKKTTETTMSTQKCTICNGARRIPWPAAGMLQDCDCVRAERGEPQVTGLLAPKTWDLPTGWSWINEPAKYGWFARNMSDYGEIWEIDAGTGVTMTSGGTRETPDNLAAIRRLVMARNKEPGAIRARGTGPRSP